MNLDHDLRRTFRRAPAPPHLADRVLARIVQGENSSASTPSGRLPPSPPGGFGGPGKPAPTSENVVARRVPRWLAAAAAVTLMAAGGARYYVYQQTVAEAERVHAEIMVALQITGDKLALVQRKVEDSQR